jgi:hypothetical protein
MQCLQSRAALYNLHHFPTQILDISFCIEYKMFKTAQARQGPEPTRVSYQKVDRQKKCPQLVLKLGKHVLEERVREQNGSPVESKVHGLQVVDVADEDAKQFPADSL